MISKINRKVRSMLVSHSCHEEVVTATVFPLADDFPFCRFQVPESRKKNSKKAQGLEKKGQEMLTPPVFPRNICRRCKVRISICVGL
jgi:hypothetical protein